MDLDEIETFVGFYSADGFWVDERINLWDRDSAEKLVGIIPEIAVRSETERFKAAVCVDGLMLLRVEHLAKVVPNIGDPRKFNESIEWWDEHLDYANALQLCIESESIKCKHSSEVMAAAVSISETCRVGFVDGMPVNRNHSNSRSLMAARHEAALWVAGGMEGSAPLEATSSGWSTIDVMTMGAIELALDKFDAVTRNANLVKWLSFIGKAKAAYVKNDYRMAFTLLWFVIESAAKTLRNRPVEDGEWAPSMKRVVDDLRAEGLINAALFDQLTLLREGIRNRLMHEPGATICLPEHCTEAAAVALDLAVRDPGLGLKMKWESGAEF